MKNYFSLFLIMLATISWATTGCGTVKPSGKAKVSPISDTSDLDAVVDGSKQQKDKNRPVKEKSPKKKPTPDELNAEALSLAAFEQTVYPILSENCQSCHGELQSPFIGHEDVATAHDAVFTSRKVDFNNIPGSRLVVRLATDSHQCWTNDCAADAAEMEVAIGLWKEKIDEAGLGDVAEDDLVTDERLFASAEQFAGQSDPGTMLQLAADYTDIRAPMTLRNDDPDGDVLNYIVTPMGNGGRILPNAVGGEAYYTFEVETAGTYALYGRVKAPDGNADSFHIRMNNGPILAWATGLSADWSWVRANQNNGMTELTFDLSPGTHTVMIKQREERTQINQIALTTQLTDFSGAEMVTDVFELRYDLQEMTGKNATLVVAVDVFDEATATYRLQDLRIETDEDIYIKDVMPRVNGQWNPQHSTFRLVDQTVVAPGASLSAATMILIGEDGWDLDQLSFGFGAIE